MNEATHTNQWCPGCGDFGILLAIKNAIVTLGYNPKDVVVASGIGCSGKLPHYIKTYGFEGLHGRALPAASGIKLANNDLHVIAVGGDGDGYGIGMGHFVHSLRRNIDMTYLVHNNQVYGLTTGQTSPTSVKGYSSKSTPHGVIEEPINPIALAMNAGGTFVARSFSGDLKHLTEMLVQADKHRGFAFIDCLQPCITFNKINTYQYFQKRCYKLGEDYDPTNFNSAMEKAWEWERTGDKIPIGVIYKKEHSTYEDELPSLKEKPLVKHDISNVNIDSIIKEYL
ncbi:2-oxoacid ferredoxin oxidoreductase [Candidatus Micrarchaeota archaeon]|nr:2-oxoacid ferredoxin oxidoreductase [Candidatus Micrarchaeota archaeon]